jgi:hypothetical protein
MTIYTNNDFLGVMGSCEMESAIARIVNLANYKQVPFARVVFSREDFKDDGFERTGFDQLLEHEWLESRFDVAKYSVGMGLVNRVRKHMKVMREREKFAAGKK